MKKECDKGWACGKGCISKNKNCLKKKSASAVLAIEKAIELITQQFEERQQLAPKERKAIKKAQAQFDELKDAQAYYKYHQAMKEIEETETPGETLKRLEEKPWTNPIYKFYNGGELSDEKNYKAKEKAAREATDRLWEKLPPKARSAIKTKGSPCSRPVEDRPEICSETNKKKKAEEFDKRGKMLLKKMLMTDLKDPVTNSLNNWRDLQPDHLVPLAKARRFDINTEAEANYNMVNGAYNQRKKAFTWDVVNNALEPLTTEEGFKAEQERFKNKQSKQQKLIESHKANLDVVDKDKQVAEQYLDSNLQKLGELKAFSKAVTDARPFNGPGGRGVYGNKSALTYLAKTRLGLEPDEGETKAFKSKVEQSKQNSSKFDEAELLARYQRPSL